MKAENKKKKLIFTMLKNDLIAVNGGF